MKVEYWICDQQGWHETSEKSFASFEGCKFLCPKGAFGLAALMNVAEAIRAGII